MEFEISRGSDQFMAALSHPFKIDSDLAQGLGKLDPISVLQGPSLVEIERAGAGG